MLVFVMLRPIQWLKIAVPLLLLAILFSPLSIFSRFISSFDASHPSNLDRIRMLQAGAEMIRDQPLFGIGPGHVKEIYPLYRAADAPRFKVPHLHNNLVQIWAERGVVAAFSYLLFIGIFISLCLRARRDPRKRSFADAGIAIAVAMAVAGLFEFNFGDTEVLLTMIDLFAVVAFVVEKQPDEPVSAGEAIETPFPLL
jgi:putative inorganic carbon (HCO3(-)) transporter